MDGLNMISNFFDENIRIVTKAGYIIAGVGVISMARRSRLLTKFLNSQDIPNHFVSKRIKLRGKVINVRLDNVVIIQHIPSFSRLHSILHFGRQESSEVPGMCLSLAGVRLNTPGCVSLNKIISNKNIWFELLSCQRPMMQCPNAIIYIRQAGFLRSVNEQAVRLGLGVAEPLNECDHPKLQRQMQRRIFKAQRFAAKKKRGIWKD